VGGGTPLCGYRSPSLRTIGLPVSSRVSKPAAAAPIARPCPAHRRPPSPGGPGSRTALPSPRWVWSARSASPRKARAGAGPRRSGRATGSTQPRRRPAKPFCRLVYQDEASTDVPVLNGLIRWLPWSLTSASFSRTAQRGVARCGRVVAAGRLVELPVRGEHEHLRSGRGGVRRGRHHLDRAPARPFVTDGRSPLVGGDRSVAADGDLLHRVVVEVGDDARGVDATRRRRPGRETFAGRPVDVGSAAARRSRASCRRSGRPARGRRTTRSAPGRSVARTPGPRPGRRRLRCLWRRWSDRPWPASPSFPGSARLRTPVPPRARVPRTACCCCRIQPRLPAGGVRHLDRSSHRQGHRP